MLTADLFVNADQIDRLPNTLSQEEREQKSVMIALTSTLSTGDA